LVWAFPNFYLGIVIVIDSDVSSKQWNNPKP